MRVHASLIILICPAPDVGFRVSQWWSWPRFYESHLMLISTVRSLPILNGPSNPLVWTTRTGRRLKKAVVRAKGLHQIRADGVVLTKALKDMMTPMRFPTVVATVEQSGLAVVAQIAEAMFKGDSQSVWPFLAASSTAGRLTSCSRRRAQHGAPICIRTCIY